MILNSNILHKLISISKVYSKLKVADCTINSRKRPNKNNWQTLATFFTSNLNQVSLFMASQTFVNTVRDQKANTLPLLFIYGKSGLGKTHLARGIEMEIQKNQQNTLFISDANSLETIDTRQIKDINAIILDDLTSNSLDKALKDKKSKENPKGLNALLNHVSEQHIPIMITSQSITKHQLQAYIDQYFFSFTAIEAQPVTHNQQDKWYMEA
ncbi:DnaA ATPase domain-containing protein [Thermoproteota archaeon]